MITYNWKSPAVWRIPSGTMKSAEVVVTPIGPSPGPTPIPPITQTMKMKPASALVRKLGPRIDGSTPDASLARITSTFWVLKV